MFIESGILLENHVGVSQHNFILTIYENFKSVYLCI